MVRAVRIESRPRPGWAPRLAVGWIALASLLSGCFNPQDVMSDRETDGGATTTTFQPALVVDRGDVWSGFSLAVVEVSGRNWDVAVADTLSERNRGLRGVSDLGDLDGMLFVWQGDATSTFGMLNVPIALDIAWFSADGTLVGRATMPPCAEEPCESYGPGRPYRYAIETVEGGFGSLDPLTFSP